MAYMPVVTVGSLLISIVAVAIAAHTKLQQRESRELRELAQKLKEIHANAEGLHLELRNQRNHIDLEGNFEDIAKEALTCSHDTDSNEIEIYASFYKLITQDDTFNEEEITNSEELIDTYKSNQSARMGVKVANRQEMYATGRKISLRNPIRYVSSIHNEIDKVEEQHSEKLEEFDDNLLEELKYIVDKIVKNNSEHLLKYNDKFVVNVDEYETTEEIADSAFEKVFHYAGIEEDLDELEELTEEIEELRQGILQASYS